MTREFSIEPTKLLKWITGLKTGFASLNAKQRDQYSWVAKFSGCNYVYTAEIDHIVKVKNVYKHSAGKFIKLVPPLTKEKGDATLSISHAQELFNAVPDSFNENLKCRLLIVKGTKFGTSTGGIKVAADHGYWQVKAFSGSVSNGYGFTLKRVTA